MTTINWTDPETGEPCSHDITGWQLVIDSANGEVMRSVRLVDRHPGGKAMTLAVSILIPTTGRRPDQLRKTLAGFTGNPVSKEILTITGTTWGAGLNELISRAHGRYLLCCCDDTVPDDGWFDAARAMLDTGTLYPASRYFHPDGQPLHPCDQLEHGTPVPWCRSFLLTRELYEECGPFIDATWYTDIEYSERITHTGRTISACDGFRFTHIGTERDWITPDVLAREEEACNTARRERAW